MISLRLDIAAGLMVCSLVSGVFLGYRYHTGREAVTKVEKLETQITVIKDQVQSESTLIYTQAQRRVKKTQESKHIEQEGVLDASLKASVTCQRDAASFSLLNRAIDIANGESDSSSVPATVFSVTEAPESLGSGDTAVGVPVNQHSR